MNKILVIAALAVLAALPIAAQKVADVPSEGTIVPPTPKASEDTPINYLGGVPATITGALDADDSTYNRVVACGSLSGVGTAVPWDSVTITNASGAIANFVVTTSLVGGGACSDTNDTFVTLYDTSFNPASPMTGCLAANDDISGATNRCSTLSFSIPPGAIRVFVVAGFNNAATANGLFAYDINFSGTTPVELVGFTAE